MKKQLRMSERRSLVDGLAAELATTLKREQVAAYSLYQTVATPDVFQNHVIATTKKYKSCATSVQHLADKAILGFKQNVERLKSFDPQLPAFSRDRRQKLSSLSHRDVRLYRARAWCAFLLGSGPSAEEVFSAAKHGSGTTLGLKYSFCNLEDKWTYPLSCTPRVKRLFPCYEAFDKGLSESIEIFNRLSDKAKYCVNTGSRLTTVDKDDTKDRVICIEPTLNMFFQQGLMHVMTSRLKSLGYDLTQKQFDHRRLALVGSLTGSLATVDFSMASDCCLLSVCRFLLPQGWFEWLMEVRCDTCTYKGEELSLPMMSSMGNATTFPLETVLFLSLALACDDYPGGVMPTLKDDTFARFSVFGDDCILPTHLAPVFMELCESVGFLVNKDKSFFGTERFRESCGVDAYRYHNVRSFYIRAPADCRTRTLLSWCYTLFNRALKTARNAVGPLLAIYVFHDSFALILRFMKDLGVRVHLVPEYFPDDAGIHLDDPRTLLFIRSNQLKMQTISADRHGTFNFSFHSWKYPKSSRYDRLHYFVGLKKCRDLEEGSYIHRRNGRYVESNMGFSAHVSWNEGWFT
nr:MAG: RNA dependent RNA polymerase [Leviviridae sp.]